MDLSQDMDSVTPKPLFCFCLVYVLILFFYFFLFFEPLTGGLAGMHQCFHIIVLLHNSFELDFQGTN